MTRPTTLPARILLVATMVSFAGCGSVLNYRAADRPSPAGPPPLVVPVASGLTSAAETGSPPSAGRSGSLLELELAEAVVMAVANNPALEVAGFGPRLADTVVREERSRFDPGLEARLLWEDSGRQLSAVQRFTFRPEDGGDGSGGEQPQRPLLLARENLTLTTTLSTLLPTGTQLSLFGAVDRSETNFTPREYEGSWTFQVVQPLLEGTGDRVNLVAVRQAENQAVQSRWELHTTVLDVVAQVERAYWDLVLARAVVDIREFGVRLASEQRQLNQDLVDTGRAVRSAVLSALADERSRQADLAEARGSVRALSVALLRLLRPPGTAPDAEIRPLTEPSVAYRHPDAEEAVQVALLGRPELVRERIEELNSELDVSAARDSAQPGLDLVAAYGRTSLGLELGGAFDHLVDDTPYDTVTLGLELELPLVRRGDRAR